MIVVGSLLDLGLEGVDGISVMRGMRLVRERESYALFDETFTYFSAA